LVGAIWATAQTTSTDADAVSVPSFDVITVAVLLTFPQLAAVVGETICTFKLAPGARVVPLPPQVSIPALIAQVHPLEVSALTMDQLVPGVVGSVSVMVTPLAVPCPVFDTVIVNPIWSPALTWLASGVFAILITAQFTVVDACAVTGTPELLPCAVAVFG